jgi:hypothetical protein
VEVRPELKKKELETEGKEETEEPEARGTGRRVGIEDET